MARAQPLRRVSRNELVEVIQQSADATTDLADKIAEIGAKADALKHAIEKLVRVQTAIAGVLPELTTIIGSGGGCGDDDGDDDDGDDKKPPRLDPGAPSVPVHRRRVTRSKR